MRVQQRDSRGFPSQILGRTLVAESLASNSPVSLTYLRLSSGSSES